jgi:hypothetical protein
MTGLRFRFNALDAQRCWWRRHPAGVCLPDKFAGETPALLESAAHKAPLCDQFALLVRNADEQRIGWNCEIPLYLCSRMIFIRWSASDSSMPSAV